MTEIDPRELRRAFGAFPTGVTVVTALGPDGAPVGFTANSFSSVSLDPPMLLVCPGKFLSSFAIFERCSRFAVSVLAEGQEDVSNTFAGYKGDRFAKVDWRADLHGVPLIEGAAAQFSCRTAQIVPAGDHVVLLGEIDGFARTEARGLGYASGQYFSLGLERAAAAPAPGRKTIAGAIVAHAGRVLLEKTVDGLRPPQLELSDRAQVRRALAEHFATAGVEVALGAAYSIFDDRETGAQFTYFRARAATDATGGLGAWVPIDALTEARIASPALAAMLRRFALEHQTQDFALYIGDERDGDIHDMATGS